MKKIKSPPVNVEMYFGKRRHKYKTYEEAAKFCGIPYWTFVSMAKEAKATIKLRKTAIVDITIFERYLEEHCVIVKKQNTFENKEDYIMPNTRKEVKDIEELIKSKKKKYVRYAEGA